MVKTPIMPPIKHGGYLLKFLNSAGTIQSDLSGMAALSWAEIEAWSHMTGNTLTPWEAEVISDLSGAYADMRKKASEPNCPAPFGEGGAQITAEGLRRMWRGNG